MIQLLRLSRLPKMVKRKINASYQLAGFRQLAVSVRERFRRFSALRYWFIFACIGIVLCVSCCVVRYSTRLIQIDTPNITYIDTCSIKEVRRPFYHTYYMQYKQDKRKFEK